MTWTGALRLLAETFSSAEGGKCWLYLALTHHSQGQMGKLHLARLQLPYAQVCPDSSTRIVPSSHLWNSDSCTHTPRALD